MYIRVKKRIECQIWVKNVANKLRPHWEKFFRRSFREIIRIQTKRCQTKWENKKNEVISGVAAAVGSAAAGSEAVGSAAVIIIIIIMNISPRKLIHEPQMRLM